MSQLILDNLEKQLEVAVKANQEVHTMIQEGKIANLKQVMDGFECPEEFTVRFREYEVGLMKEGSNWESARVNIDTDYDFRTNTKSIKTSVNANGGSNVDDLLAQAKFVQFTSPKLEEFRVAVESIVKYFDEAKKSTGKDVRDIERAISDVEHGMRQLKIKEIKDQMLSSEGFDSILLESTWGGFDIPRITLKRNWDREVVNVKLTNETKSGKSVDVTYTYRLYDGTLRTGTEERVRMENVDKFISHQLYRLEKIEEGELVQVTLQEIENSDKGTW